MKHLIILIALSFAQTLLAQNHVNFLNQDLKKAKEKAKTEKKLLFIDTYATWCGPCKQMDKKVFNDPEVIEYFNKTFINVKIDVDTEEGQAIANSYHIDEVPTLLFINAEGKVLRRLSGYYPVQKLIEQANETVAGK